MATARIHYFAVRQVSTLVTELSRLALGQLTAPTCVVAKAAVA